MAGIAKCLSVMTGVGLLGGAASSYYVQSKNNKNVLKHASAIAKDGSIPIGGRTKDGAFWDGSISVDEYKKTLDKNAKISSAVIGVLTAVTTGVISGLTLLLRGKIK